jgi:hypothetical protein
MTTKLVLKTALVAASLLNICGPAMAKVFDIYVTPQGDVVTYQSWGTFGSYSEVIAAATVNSAYHRNVNGSGNSSSTTLSFASTLFTIPISDILTASLNYKIVDIWTYDGRDNVATFSGGGTVLHSNGTGWKSFDITGSLKESLATSPASINYVFNYTGDSGFTFSSADGRAPAFIRITLADVVTKAIDVTILPSWNLIGNSVNAPLDVAATLGDSSKISTVWKWVPATSRWAFYTPSLTDGGAAYAASKGYDFLTTVNGGEGFWVNAKVASILPLPTGTALTTISFQDQPNPAQNKLMAGWNLIANGDNISPSTFNHDLSLMPPAPGATPINVTTLWAWDSTLGNWYFYAPSLEANGGLPNYIASKKYLDFAVKALDPTMGFWVNRP